MEYIFIRHRVIAGSRVTDSRAHGQPARTRCASASTGPALGDHGRVGWACVAAAGGCWAFEWPRRGKPSLNRLGSTALYDGNIRKHRLRDLFRLGKKTGP